MLNRKKPSTAWLYLLLSFLLPALLIIAALAALHITPFGDHTFVISDANGLYVNNVSYAARMVQGKEGVLYSLEKGLGGNMMTHLGGSLLNPFFLLFVLFDIVNYPLAYTWIVLLNLSACGPAMYLLLADLHGHRPGNLIFSTAYALMGFNVANAFQVHFFTGVFALPLMTLGLRRIFQGKSPLLYILSLAYSLITAFYFGFVLCVFSVLLYCLLLWLRYEELEGQRASVTVHYALSSLFAGLLTMLVWFPAFLGMQGGRLEQNSVTDFTAWENMPFLEMGSKLFSGAHSTDELVNGLPNIFVGILPVALVILFFFNAEISRRKKAVAGAALGFYLLCFYIDAFNMFMHGGTRTNWFNYRYSFVFSFLVLVIASYEWQFLDRLTNKELKRCLTIMVLATLAVFSKKYEFVMGGAVVCDFCLLALVYLAYRMYRKDPVKNPKRTFELFALLLVSIQLAVNFGLSTSNVMKKWDYKDTDYKDTVMIVQPLVEAIQKTNEGFFRMEVSPQRSETCGNDPMLYGYNGIGHGGSNERDFVRKGLSKLGVPWYDMRSYYNEAVPSATDTLLGVKYVIADGDLKEEKGYTQKIDAGRYSIFENSNALPLAVLSKRDLSQVEMGFEDVFENLNRVWSTLSGSDQQVFVEEDQISFRSLNLSDPGELDAQKAREIVQQYEKKDSSSDSESMESAESSQSEDNALSTHIIMDVQPQFSACMEFSFTASQDGPVYVYHRAALLSDMNGAIEPVVKCVGYYHKNDIVTGYLPVQGDYVNQVAFEEYAGRFRAAYADLDALRALSETVRSQPATVEVVKDSHIQGTFTAGQDEQLLFTIPWDEGWTCWVDGEKTELTKVLGVFMAVQTTPGTHSFEMKYVPAGLSVGLKIAAVALALLVLYLLLGRRWIDRHFIKKLPHPSGMESKV